ncbi:MAG: hypothetical protein BGO30_03980 [Bacteroidetes bacterium 41-46]|nr:MAG: hypothetical protein BGO30_03980 [Bacteroidetes bacterium 41-46]
MKKLLFIIAVILIASCEKEPSSKGKLNPNALISIRPAAGVKSNLSAKDIVKNTRNISFYNPAISGTVLTRAFAEAQRDTINVRLLMWGTDIIDQSGRYTGDFIEGRDFVFRKSVDMNATPPVYDTIAYIPNAIITEARGKIITAFADSNFVEVYRLFDVAFTFTPTSGEEWRALKAAGQN